MVGIFFLAISTGLPISLGVETFKVWMWEEGNSLVLVAFLHITTLPYLGKIFLGPIVDQVRLPVLSHLLGRRRSWAFLSQVTMMVGFWCLGKVVDTHDLWAVLAVLSVISLASAANLTALNAYRIEIVPSESSYIAASMGSIGYRIGKLLGGAGALLLADAMGWRFAYIFIPFIFLITVSAVLMVEEPVISESAKAQHTAETAGLKEWFSKRVLTPLQSFIKQYPRDWKLISLFILMFGVGDFLIDGVATIFYLDSGFSKVVVANVTKAFSIICTIIGGIIGGQMVIRLGIKRMIYATTLLHCLFYVTLFVLAHVGDSLPWLYASIVIEFLTEGMKTSALVAYVSLLCDKTYYTASQYALFSSIKVLLRPFVGAISGVLATQLGWFAFFGLSMVLSLVPLIFYYHIQYQPQQHDANN